MQRSSTFFFSRVIEHAAQKKAFNNSCNMFRGKSWVRPHEERLTYTWPQKWFLPSSLHVKQMPMPVLMMMKEKCVSTCKTARSVTAASANRVDDTRLKCMAYQRHTMKPILIWQSVTTSDDQCGARGVNALSKSEAHTVATYISK